MGDGTKKANVIGRNANRVFNLGEDGFALTRMMPYMVEDELQNNTSRSGKVYVRSCARLGGPNGPLTARPADVVALSTQMNPN